MKALTLAATTFIAASAAAADTPVLTVYAGDYFTSEWGPGPVIEKEFEANAIAIWFSPRAICCHGFCSKVTGSKPIL